MARLTFDAVLNSFQQLICPHELDTSLSRAMNALLTLLCRYPTNGGTIEGAILQLHQPDTLNRIHTMTSDTPTDIGRTDRMDSLNTLYMPTRTGQTDTLRTFLGPNHFPRLGYQIRPSSWLSSLARA